LFARKNSSIYPFQLEDLLKNVFNRFEDYFIEKVGFAVAEAYYFGLKIIKRYERLLNEQLVDIKKFEETSLGDLKVSIKASDIFVFTLDEFCKDEKITNKDKVKSYLNALSCKFG
jgi:hypothetical protein